MDLLNPVRVGLILGPIVLLLALGVGLTVRSGVVNLTSGQGLRRAVGNLSQTLLLVTLCLLFLAFLQGVVGFKLGLM